MRLIKTIYILLCVSIIITFLHFEKHLSGVYIGVAAVFYLLNSAIHLLAHECGHLIGGAISGYKLLRLQLGPLNIIINSNNKPELLWRGSFSGQCVMIPKQVDPVRYKAYNMGGILANALIVISSSVLLLPGSFWASLLFVESATIGIQKILVNAIPHKTNSIPNDGYIVKLLNKDDAVKKDYAMYLRLYGKLFLNEDVLIQDYIYEREISKDADEMLYYNEIQDILHSMKAEKSLNI